MGDMKKVQVLIEIVVDEDKVTSKYPNYRFNWDSTDEFIDHLIDSMEWKDRTTDNLMNEYGFSIRALSREEAKLNEGEKDYE